MLWECCLNQTRSKLSVDPPAQPEEIAAILCALLVHAQADDHAVAAQPVPWKLAMRHPDLEIDELRTLMAGRKHVY